MGLLTWFSGWSPFKGPEKIMGDESLQDAIKKGKCPDCGGDQWYEGPSGGININYKCANEKCGSEFNIAMFGGSLIFAERIKRDSKVDG